MEALHRPVMLREALEFLDLGRARVAVDATCGEGGHTAAMLERMRSDAVLLAVDRDSEVLKVMRVSVSFRHPTPNFRDCSTRGASVGRTRCWWTSAWARFNSAGPSAASRSTRPHSTCVTTGPAPGRRPRTFSPGPPRRR